MEKAILKTLIYYNIFNFPLKAWEIHKWLIGREASLKQVDKSLKSLEKKAKIKKQADLYFLVSGKGLVKDRLQKESYSRGHLKVAKYISALFKIIPWIKLVGISGSLSVMGSSNRDDIDLFIITSKNRIWITRLLLIFLTSLTGLRRTRREKILSAHGKICINLILSQDTLEQKKKNIYVAHEVLQMKLLWQRDEVYSDFLQANSWAFKLLPNWKSTIIESQKSAHPPSGSKIKNQKHNSKFESSGIIDMLEELAKKMQLMIMGNPDKSERIENSALYFHPEDKGVKILKAYKKRITPHPNLLP